MSGGDETMSQKSASSSRLPLLVAGTGAAHAILFLIGVWLLDRASRPANASDEAMAAYLASDAPRSLTLVALHVAPFAGIALIWFVSSLRTWLGPRVTPADELFLGIQGLSAALYVAVMFVSAAALASPLAVGELAGAEIDATMLRLLPRLAETLMLVFGVRCAAMVAISSSRLGLKTGLFPRWVAYLGIIAGVCLFLSGPLSDALILVFPTWLLLLSATLVVSTRNV
jgi:hypothetical protein